MPTSAGRREIVGGFLQRFADDCLLQRFVRVEVAGRLVDADAIAGLFFDQQELAIFFDDGGNSEQRVSRYAAWVILERADILACSGIWFALRQIWQRINDK
jgi:hypothetical protein